ncbi:MAG TPA: YicC family protein [Candidatus Scatomonas pullistercoris]|uniref:YicC family protein n=1 Tax=Candidatus Scatomonas pullistercoris TaxID=2840920 RepID=A0A9D1P167_9FIRM|nr:YicC family protein [Candidatus Scatomonas pullistercoris]
MIKSMTGFGRAEIQETGKKVLVEMKSVNHRYLDFNLKLPRRFSFVEAAVRGVLKEYIQRGKVDVYIFYEDESGSQTELKYNSRLAEQYVAYLARMREDFSLEEDLTASRLACMPEVLTMEDQPVDEEEIWALLERALRSACDKFTESRQREGEALRKDLLEKLSRMLGYVEAIEQRSPAILEEYREKLRQKTRELLENAQLEESRLATEVVLFADKICTDEETVRLKSHVTGMMQVLRDGGAIGRKLDFIAQEMNREANTILSKANDLTVSDIGIELKTEIEKIREQIQNIE